MAVDEVAHDRWIDLMFDLLNPGVKLLDGIPGFHRNRPLLHNRSVIDLLINEVNSHSRHFHSPLEGSFYGMGSGKGREQGRVDVEDPIGKSLDESR
jgi:hypothetical protein